MNYLMQMKIVLVMAAVLAASAVCNAVSVAESNGVALYTGACQKPSGATSQLETRIKTFAPSAPTSLRSTPSGAVIFIR